MILMILVAAMSMLVIPLPRLRALGPIMAAQIVPMLASAVPIVKAEYAPRRAAACFCMLAGSAARCGQSAADRALCTERLGLSAVYRAPRTERRGQNAADSTPATNRTPRRSATMMMVRSWREPCASCGGCTGAFQRRAHAEAAAGAALPNRRILGYLPVLPSPAWRSFLLHFVWLIAILGLQAWQERADRQAWAAEVRRVRLAKVKQQ